MERLISLQAAIDAIREDADWLESQGSDWQTERKERDFQILAGLPSAQPSFSRDHENDHSAEASKMVAQPEITAEDVKEYCRKRCLIVLTCDLYEEMMKRWSSVQPEPDIIACGDCKHYICHDRRCGYWNHGVKPLEWCCHAERR